MGSSADYAWVYQSLGALVGAVGALFFFRSLFHDRSRGLRRCPRCWYGMDGVPGLRCPECGRAARSERATRRTRRHWRAAAFGALLALAGWLIGEAPGLHRRGWITLAPTTALIWWNLHHPPPTPVYGASPVLSAADTELVHRMNKGSLAGWQWRWFLQELPLIRAHRRWDTQTPLPVEISPPMWVPIDRVHIEPKLRNANDLFFVQPTPQDAGILLPGQQEAVFETSVKVGPFARSKWRWTGELRVPVAATESPDEAFAPCRSYELDTAVGRAMRLRLEDGSTRSGTPPDVGIRLSIDRTVDDRLRPLAFGLVVDVLRDGRVLRSLPLPASSFRVLPLPTAYSGFSWPWERDGLPDAAELSRWSLRIRGDRANAISSWAHDAYWAGEVACPIASYFSDR